MKPSAKKQHAPTLDLHGFKTDEVFDALEAFLARHEGASRVRVVHGKGTGKVKAKVLEYLKLAHYPSAVERTPNGDPNDGVLIVYLD